MKRLRMPVTVMSGLLLLVCAVVSAADAKPGTTIAETPAQLEALHPYVPVHWLVGMTVMALLYVATAARVDRDTHHLDIKGHSWNLAFVALIGVQPILFFTVPIYLSVPLGLIVYVVLLNRFVHARNQCVIDRDKVFTRGHLNVLMRRMLSKFGIKVTKADETVTAVGKDRVPVSLTDSDGKMISTADRLDRDEPIQQLKDILALACEDHARQVHLVPSGASVKVQFLIDGVLHEAGELDRQKGSAVLLRVKSLVSEIGSADRSESDLPRFKMGLPLSRREVYGTLYETVIRDSNHTVIQLSDPGRKPLTLEQLGMDEPVVSEIRRLADANDGVLVFAGPSGSGRRTTLYALLESMDAYTRNIGTIEAHPPLRKLANINQDQLADHPDRNVPEILTGMFRQDYNIVMLDGVTDAKTVLFCLGESARECLIILGVGTPEVSVTLGAMLKVGAKPEVLAETLRAIVAQKLVRALCRKCRRPFVPDEETLSKLTSSADVDLENMSFYEEVGCKMCRNTGYAGRVGIFEFLPIVGSIRESLAGGGSAAEVMKVAQHTEGYVSMAESTLWKVAKGVTSLKEVHRNLSGGSG